MINFKALAISVSMFCIFVYPAALMGSPNAIAIMKFIGVM